MPPGLFAQLTNISGFCNTNGKTYQEHIVLIFAEDLSTNQKKAVTNTSTEKDALVVLQKENIAFTHDWENK